MKLFSTKQYYAYMRPADDDTYELHWYGVLPKTALNPMPLSWVTACILGDLLTYKVWVTHLEWIIQHADKVTDSTNGISVDIERPHQQLGTLRVENRQYNKKFQPWQSPVHPCGGHEMYGIEGRFPESPLDLIRFYEDCRCCFRKDINGWHEVKPFPEVFAYYT